MPQRPATRSSARVAGGGQSRGPDRRTETTARPSVGDRVREIADVVAPTTVVAALLYYYGYVTTYARYSYFGIDLATLRLSTQELTLQSVAAIYFPLGVALVVVLVGIGGNLLIRSWVGDDDRRRVVAGGVLAVVGAVLLVRACAGILVPDIARTETIGVTPGSLGVGTVLVAYGLDLGLRGRAPERPRHLPSRRTLWGIVFALVALSAFWLANSFAGAYGRGQAEVIAGGLGDRPGVVLDTRERLYVTAPGVTETALPAGPDQQFRYRYRGYRLLVAAGNRLFLVPAPYQRGASTVLVVADDGSVRLQFAP